MKSVLLLSLPYIPNYMRNARCDFVSLSKTQWFPLWLGYLGAFLEGRGYRVKLVDGPAYGLRPEDIIKIAQDFQPDYLVVYTGRMSEESDIRQTERLSYELGVPAVYVGPFASIDPTELALKSPRVGRVVRGEFEFPVLDLLKDVDSELIPGLIWIEEGVARENPTGRRLVREDLDRIPFVTKYFSDNLDLKYYRTPSEYHPFLDLMTGRGCAWGRCTYCLWVHTFIEGDIYNTRSPESVTEELLYIEKWLPHVRSVMIQDDTLTSERALELSESFLRAGVRIPWSCYSRGNQHLPTLKVMKRAGCRNLHVGFESASPEILKRIEKGLTTSQMSRFAEHAKAAGLRLHGDFAIGFPGETRQSVEATVDWACKIRPHTAQFQIMIPLPGTPFHDELSEKGWLEDGCASYPNMSASELEVCAKQAYRRYYISLWFAGQMLLHPKELILSKLSTYMHAIPSIFWEKYVR